MYTFKKNILSKKDFYINTQKLEERNFDGKGIVYNEKTPQFHGEFSSLTITIFPSFIKKTNEILKR